jgi:hypothetical protein
LQNGTTNVSVGFSGSTTITPNSLALVPNAIVEVHGAFNGTTFAATLITVEDDAQFEHQGGDEFDIEGLVSGCNGANPCTSFNVGAQAVQVNPQTQFVGGLATDLADGVQVEAEGHQFTGPTLIAEKIEFKRSVIRLQGATSNSTATSFDMLIAGTITVTIQVDSLTKNGTIPVDGTTCVQVRGQRQSPATTPAVVLAGELASCNNGNRNLIQAPVEQKNAPTTITLLGSAIDVSNPSNGFQGLNGPFPSGADFFNAITTARVNSGGVAVPGTLVQVTFDTGTAVHEVEIEDEQ